MLWNKRDGKRGWNGISSIMYKYLQTIDQRKFYGTLSFDYYNCADQNWPRIVKILNFHENVALVRNIKITYMSLAILSCPWTLFVVQ